MLSRAAIRSYSSAAVKVNARDAPGALTSLSVVVKSGSKTGKPGLAHLLSTFNFLNTEPKSALRFTRESELLGGIVSSQVTRDAIVLKTQFLKEDLPYYVEALGNVLAKSSYRPHELVETVLPAAKAAAAKAYASNAFVALEDLHAITFRKGLGNPLYYDGVTKFSVDDIRAYAQSVYVTDNITVHASGANPADLEKFIGESAFSELANGSSSAASVKSFTGKESRTRAAGASTALIGVPVKPADFAKYEVLSAAVGSSSLPSYNSPLSAISGATSTLYKYQDAGLFVVSVSGEAQAVAEGIKAAKKVVDSVSGSVLSKSVKSAQLAVALQSTLENPLDIKISSSPQAVKLGAFNYVAVGDVDVLPYAEEL